mmetsp:Transcript_60104/g.161210  ORF Transcript_60104/g.161210 Transcript_60104/m.161210 type:complete len:220 (-) Transcript_60104:981-1640(-)
MLTPAAGSPGGKAPLLVARGALAVGRGGRRGHPPRGSGDRSSDGTGPVQQFAATAPSVLFTRLPADLIKPLARRLALLALARSDGLYFRRRRNRTDSGGSRGLGRRQRRRRRCGGHTRNHSRRRGRCGGHGGRCGGGKGGGSDNTGGVPSAPRGAEDWCGGACRRLGVVLDGGWVSIGLQSLMLRLRRLLAGRLLCRRGCGKARHLGFHRRCRLRRQGS